MVHTVSPHVSDKIMLCFLGHNAWTLPLMSQNWRIFVHCVYVCQCQPLGPQHNSRALWQLTEPVVVLHAFHIHKSSRGKFSSKCEVADLWWQILTRHAHMFQYVLQRATHTSRSIRNIRYELLLCFDRIIRSWRILRLGRITRFNRTIPSWRNVCYRRICTPSRTVRLKRHLCLKRIMCCKCIMRTWHSPSYSGITVGFTDM